ncbi:ABC transporter substrate-binding protein [candidate division KSB1 bacterium]
MRINIKIINNIILFILIFVLYFQQSRAQQRETQIVQIYAVMSSDLRFYREAYEGFQDGLLEANIRFNIDLKRKLNNGNSEESIIREINDKKPDLILAIGTRAADFLCKNIKDIPIVFSMVNNPVFNNNSAFENNNVTGVTLSIPPLTQFRVLKQVYPGLQNIGVIYTKNENVNLINMADDAAGRLNLNLYRGEITNAREVPTRLENLMKFVDMIWIIIDSAVGTEESWRHIILECFRNNIPVAVPLENRVHAGGAFAVSADYKMIGMQSAELARKIIQGIPASRLGFESPKEIILYVNERITNGIGIKIPEFIGNNLKVVYIYK